MRVRHNQAEQGRQDSNLQPPVLETGALPIELRPSVRAEDCTPTSTGTSRRMTDVYEDERDAEREDDELLEGQERKGFGEDEGEQDEAIEHEG